MDKMSVEFRRETEADYREVENLVREAFWNVYAPGCVEHYVLHVMRRSPDFIAALDLVAVLDGRIVGSVACMKSHIAADDGKLREVVTLGPISVHPSVQGEGIGRRLIEHVICRAGRLGYDMVVLCGDPLFYSRCGFEQAAKYSIRTGTNKLLPALQVRVLNSADGAVYRGRYYENSVYDIDMSEAEAFDRTFPEREKIADTPTQLRFKRLVTQGVDYVEGKRVIPILASFY